MESSEVSTVGVVLTGIVLVVGVLGYPLFQAWLLSLTARLFGFELRTYGRSVLIVSIGLIGLMFGQGLSGSLACYSSGLILVETVLITGVCFSVAAVVSTKILFRESTIRAIGAVLVSSAFGLVCSALLFVLTMLAILIVGGIAGLAGS